MSGGEGWLRLHPLSPIVRGGRTTIAIAIVLLPSLAAGRNPSGELVQLAIVGVLVLLGFVSWLVTRWRIDGDDLRIETGVLRRQSLRFPLQQVQAVDVIRPGIARVLRVAELRLRMGGATGSTARLAYVAERDAEPLRDRLLALARGARHEERDAASPPAAGSEQVVVTAVPTGRLIASILISDVGIFAEAVLVVLAVTAVYAPQAAAAFVSGGAVWLVGVATVVWRRFNQEYRLTVSEVPEGLQLSGGLIALTAETIRPGRVQAVRMVEPFLWRRLGWCRLQVDLAGRQRSKGEAQEARRALRTVLPVGSRRAAEALVDRILDGRPRASSPPPPRARWKSPVRYRMLAWGRSDRCVFTRSGRIRRVSCWVPLDKVQSLRHVQGPLQRRLRLASVHVDTAGRNVHATLRDRDAAEAEGALHELAGLARGARKSARNHLQSGAQAG